MIFSRIRARRYTGPQEPQTKEKRHSTAKYFFFIKNDLILEAVPKYENIKFLYAIKCYSMESDK